MIVSKITSKGQTTIPQPVRTALNLHPGDEIGYQIEAGRVILFKVESVRDDPFIAFGEWASEADQRAYGML
jgi:antitoxin PrlF